MNNLNKVLTTLSIAASDTRGDSIKSIILNTLFESASETSYSDLIDNISILYDIQLYEPELKESLKLLVDNGELISNSKGYKISKAEKDHLALLEQKIKSEERKRYLNFKAFLDETFNNVISAADVKLLWEVFRQYLYNCFFHYGEKATEFFFPKNENSIYFQNTEILKDAYNQLKIIELQNVFKRIIDDFPDNATQEDIDFVNDLGQKTLSFASLGLEPDLAKDQIDFNLVDWILYLDTNFLFSILNLHVNVENDSAKELLKLIIANPDFIKIQFRYSELTLRELRSKKNDFISLEEQLTKSGIQALLESEELDAFSRKYYEGLLDNPEGTLHPNQIIDLAELTLNTQEIKISRNIRQVEHLGESFLNVKIQEYSRYIEQQNEIRDDFKAKNGGKSLRNYYRSESQLIHDITLREMIINSRDNFKQAGNQTLNDIKYFGVTLDDLLIKFDSYELRKGEIRYPTFFKPSFLLNKLVKILPIKTDNYKRAFIKAVSSRGFNKDSKKSEDVIKIVNYLRTIGIDDKKVLLNLITERLFVEKFRTENLNEEEKKAFVESELNKIITQTGDELQEAERKINVLEQQTETDEVAKTRLNEEKEKASEDVKLFKNAVDTLNKHVKRLTKNTPTAEKQITFDFESEYKSKTIQELTNKLAKQEDVNRDILNELKRIQRKEFENAVLKKWRGKTWTWLTISLSILILSILALFYFSAWDLTSFDTNIKKIQGHFLVTLIFAFAAILFNGVIITVLILKYQNHSNINAFISKIEYPKEL